MWQKIKNFSRKDPLIFALVIIVIVVVGAFGSIEMMHLTGTDKFCKTCHAVQDVAIRGEHYTWDLNIHSKADVSCLDCHGAPGVMGYLNAHVVNGMKSMYHEIVTSEEKVNEMLTKASTVPEAAEHASPQSSCLFCHSDGYNDQYRRDKLVSLGIKFRNIDDVKQPQYRETYGLSDVLVDPVSKGVEPSHAGHLDRGLLCANCHLGVAHGGELYNKPKMQTCFDCHDNIADREVSSAPANDDCASCHVMQKGIQEGTYVEKVEPIRWYMADLTCGDCHESAFTLPQKESCATCHDDSYADLMTDTQSAYNEKLAQAKAEYARLFAERADMPQAKRAIYNEYARIIRIAEEDGSKGVHNPEYIDELFNKALELVESIDKWSADAVPAVETTESKPVVEAVAPVAVVTPVVEEAPAVEEAPVATPAPVAQATEAPKAAPAPVAAPVEEPKGVNPADLMDIASAIETIDLAEKYVPAPTKAAVVFPHFEHAERLACATCHADPEAGSLKFVPGEVKGMKNAFHDQLCIKCHTEMRVPKTCATCHK
jgi:nitrate/TMAO reductase-like tetraheme cytochrome c subunit